MSLFNRIARVFRSERSQKDVTTAESAAPPSSHPGKKDSVPSTYSNSDQEEGVLMTEFYALEGTSPGAAEYNAGAASENDKFPSDAQMVTQEQKLLNLQLRALEAEVAGAQWLRRREDWPIRPLDIERKARNKLRPPHQPPVHPERAKRHTSDLHEIVALDLGEELAGRNFGPANWVPPAIAALPGVQRFLANQAGNASTVKDDAGHAGRPPAPGRPVIQSLDAAVGGPVRKVPVDGKPAAAADAAARRGLDRRTGGLSRT